MAQKKGKGNGKGGKKNTPSKNTPERETEQVATMSEEQLAQVVAAVTQAMQANGGGNGGGKPKFEVVDEKIVFDNGTVRHVVQKTEMTRNGVVEYLIIFAQQRKATKASKGVKKGQWRNVKVSGGFRYEDQDAIVEAVASL